MLVANVKVMQKKMERLADDFGVPTADLALATRLRCYEVIVQVQAIALIRRLLELSLPSIKCSQLQTANELALSINET